MRTVLPLHRIDAAGEMLLLQADTGKQVGKAHASASAAQVKQHGRCFIEIFHFEIQISCNNGSVLAMSRICSRKRAFSFRCRFSSTSASRERESTDFQREMGNSTDSNASRSVNRPTNFAALGRRRQSRRLMGIHQGDRFVK